MFARTRLIVCVLCFAAAAGFATAAFGEDFSFAAPLDSSAPIVSEAPGVVEARAVAPAAQADDTLPTKDGARVGGVAVLVAGALFLLLKILQSPVLGAVWAPMPAFWKVVAIAFVGALATGADRYANGGSWGDTALAVIGGMVTALGPSALQQKTREKTE